MKHKVRFLGFQSIKPSRLIQRLVLSLLLASFLAPPSFADSMQDSLEEAASILADSKLTLHKDRFILIEVVNLHSKKRDQTAKAIETQLYQSLGKVFKDFKLLFLEDSLAGVNLHQALFIHGTYEPKGKLVAATFTVVIGMRGDVVGQAQVTFDAPKVVQEALVAVLDLEAPELTASQRQGYSDLFRSRLQESKKMKLASSAEVAKMSPDAIQETYNCTRDECATIIGEQLGVDRVISTSLIAMGKERHMLSAKIMDIKNGSILSSKTLEHTGDLGDLGTSLRTLADQLVGLGETQEGTQPQVVSVDETGSEPWVWHGAALGTLSLSLASSSSAVKKYDSLVAENNTLEARYKLVSTQVEMTALEEQFAANKAKMKTLRTQWTQFNALALGAGLWETYLLLFGGEVEVASAHQPGLHFAMESSRASEDSARLSLSYTW